MRRTLKLSVLILIAATLLNACAPVAPAAEPETQPSPSPSSKTEITPPSQIPVGFNIGNQALDFELKTLDGQTINLSSLRGKPVLVNFWATWCPPCKAEMPYLQKVHETWAEKGLILLAIDIDESPAVVQKFMKEMNLSMTIPMDVGGKVAKAYGVTAIPTTYLIDKDGIIRQKVIGAFPSVAAIEKELTRIMPQTP